MQRMRCSGGERIWKAVQMWKVTSVRQDSEWHVIRHHKNSCKTRRKTMRATPISKRWFMQNFQCINCWLCCDIWDNVCAGDSCSVDWLLACNCSWLGKSIDCIVKRHASRSSNPFTDKSIAALFLRRVWTQVAQTISITATKSKSLITKLTSLTLD